jgi:LDH2 family malate/lactate/ureidoglycolate dehydrogenase
MSTSRREKCAILAVGAAIGAIGHALAPHIASFLKRCTNLSAFTPPSSKSILIPASALQAFVSSVLVTCGVNEDDAATAAKVLILADLRGIDSHGIARLRAYFNMLREGIINPRPNIRIVSETQSTALVDGDNGLGLIVGPKCNAIAMRKAESAGSGWVSVRNTHHYGIAGGYCLEAMERGLIGISMTNSGAVVAPLWGRARMLGTNPIAMAFPGKAERGIVVDMATSVVPWGKVEECARIGQDLRTGWAISLETGEPVIAPEECLRNGALMNLGGERWSSGHKGYCLAAAVDILCAVLSGGRWGPTVGGFTTHEANTGTPGVSPTTESRASDGEQQSAPKQPRRIDGIGHFFGALNIDGFRKLDGFRATIDEWAKTFRACPRTNPTRSVMVPGDPEWEAFDERSKAGVPVKASVLADLVDVAEASGVALPFDRTTAEQCLAHARRVQVDRA